MRPSWCPPRIFKTFSWGLFGHPRSLQGGEKVPSWLLRARGRPQNRSTPVLQGGRAPWALPPCKTGVDLACARGIVNMESIGLVAICGAPSGDLEAPKNFFFRFCDFRTFFLGAWSPPPWPFPVAPRRPQEVSRHDPNHLWMQKSDFAKMLVFLKKTKGF